MKCPACKSGNVVSQESGGYKCRACGATFKSQPQLKQPHKRER